MITPRQRDLLAFISSQKTCPSFREMGRALGYPETNLTAPIWHLLKQLEVRGYIRRLKNRNRAIEVIPQTVTIRGERFRFIPKAFSALSHASNTSRGTERDNVQS